MSALRARLLGWLGRPMLVASLFALASYLLADAYLRRVETQVAGGKPIALLFLVRDARSGTVLTREDFAVRDVPEAYVDERDVRAFDLEKVVGVSAAFDLASQQVVEWTDLSVRPDSRHISQLVTPGRRAVPVRLGKLDASSARLIRPGDYVDVIATLDDPNGRTTSSVLLQRVLVLAVAGVTERRDGRDAQQGSDSYSEEDNLMLSLDLEETQLLTLAAARGELAVAVRHPDDQRVHDGMPQLSAATLLEAQNAMRAQKNRSQAGQPIKLTEAE